MLCEVWSMHENKRKILANIKTGLQATCSDKIPWLSLTFKGRFSLTSGKLFLYKWSSFKFMQANPPALRATFYQFISERKWHGVRLDIRYSKVTSGTSLEKSDSGHINFDTKHGNLCNASPESEQNSLIFPDHLAEIKINSIIFPKS